MKKSYFTQQLEVQGSVSKVTGSITVTMNYTIESYMSNNPSTHEEENRSRYLHKVEGFIEGKLHCKDTVKSENAVFTQISECKRVLLEDMTKMSNAPLANTFEEKMKKLGFN